MVDELFQIFKRNLPFIIRDAGTVTRLLSDTNNKVFEERDDNARLIGVSVVNKNTIYLFCVDRLYRRHGIGTRLLNESENYVLKNGYSTIQVGAGDDYLMPGIPTNRKPFEEELDHEDIDPEVTNEACTFFTKRGYFHSWKNANCFDMKADLSKIAFPRINIGDIVDGILYRWAELADIPNVIECTDDAEPSFSQYYKDENLYKKKTQRVLVASYNNKICGTLIVNIETDGVGLGSVSCTTVAHKYQGKHIGTNLVILGTKFLQSLGLNHGYLGYTYSGLNRMYGYAGYMISVYYNMASKVLR